MWRCVGERAVTTVWKEGSAFIFKDQAVFVENSGPLIQEHGVTFQKTWIHVENKLFTSLVIIALVWPTLKDVLRSAGNTQ